MLNESQTETLLEEINAAFGRCSPFQIEKTLRGEYVLNCGGEILPMVYPSLSAACFGAQCCIVGHDTAQEVRMEEELAIEMQYAGDCEFMPLLASDTSVRISG